MNRVVKKYRAVAGAYLKSQLIWRMNVWVDVLLSGAKILFAWILWGILFGENEQIAGFCFSDMMSYYIVSSYLYQLDQSAEISRQISNMIRSGAFSKYMILPVRMEGYFIAMEAGKIACSGVIGFAAALMWVRLFGISFVFAADVQSALAGLILLILGLLFMAELNIYLGILTLRFEENGVFLMIKDNLAAFVTGAVVPLALMPESVIRWMKLLPFYYITYLPSMLFIDRCREEAAGGLMVLGCWCVGFALLNRVAYEKYRIRYDGVGI